MEIIYKNQFPYKISIKGKSVSSVHLRCTATGTGGIASLGPQNCCPPETTQSPRGAVVSRDFTGAGWPDAGPQNTCFLQKQSRS